jgi:hypothetical protein
MDSGVEPCLELLCLVVQFRLGYEIMNYLSKRAREMGVAQARKHSWQNNFHHPFLLFSVTLYKYRERGREREWFGY